MSAPKRGVEGRKGSSIRSSAQGEDVVEAQFFNSISHSLEEPSDTRIQMAAEDTGLSQEQIQAIEQDTSEDLDLEVEFATVLAIDRQQRVEKIGEETVLVHGLIENLNTIVHKNSEIIDTIDSVVTRVNADVKSAYGKLTNADNHLRSQRQHACCLTLCLSFAVIVFVLFIILVLRP